MKAYELITNGFTIKIDRNLYAREAVMKALYRFHVRYIISYETEGAFIKVFFETRSNIDSVDKEVAEIMQELSFQMLRLDTARRTKSIRELLVARALYATCIESEREVSETCNAESNWQDDQEQIFTSWSAE